MKTFLTWILFFPLLVLYLAGCAAREFTLMVSQISKELRNSGKNK